MANYDGFAPPVLPAASWLHQHRDCPVCLMRCSAPRTGPGLEQYLVFLEYMAPECSIYWLADGLGLSFETETVSERKRLPASRGGPSRQGLWNMPAPLFAQPMAEAPLAGLESFPPFPAPHCPLNPNQSGAVHLASVLLSVVQERRGQKAVCNVRKRASQSGGHVREPQKRYHQLSLH